MHGGGYVVGRVRAANGRKTNLMRRLATSAQPEGHVINAQGDVFVTPGSVYSRRVSFCTGSKIRTMRVPPLSR